MAEEHSVYVQLALKTIDTFLKSGKIIEPPDDLPDELINEKAGAFVSLHKKNGDLRGCIGTILPTQPNIASEIIQNAISASTKDPRFLPMKSEEFDDIECSVDILGKPEPINSLNDLDPKKYGVIVESGFQRGLLLPDLEGVDTAEYQVAIACQKAGLTTDDPIKLYRFTVTRYH